MRKGAIKNFSHVLLLGALMLGACSKGGETVKPVTPPPSTGTDTTATPPPTTPPPGEDSFPTETLGLSTEKVTGDVGNINPEYVLYVPDTYNSDKTKKWPLVIFLHGVGEMGTDINKVKNVGLCKVVKGKQFVMVAPQCTRWWWNTDALQQFFKQIITKYHVDPSRVYLTGLSMGGFQTWVWGEYYPEQFAAIAPICGGGEVDKACSLKNMPVWAFHNADDPTVSVNNSRDMVNAIKACGSTLLKYTEYPTGGHDAWTKTYADADLYTWLLQQHK